MADFEIKPITSFYHTVNGEKVYFKKALDGTILYSDSMLSLDSKWRVAEHEMKDAYEEVIENQKNLINFVMGTKYDLSPYILANKQFNCPYMYDRELLFYADRNSNGLFDQDELSVEINDYDRNGNPDHIAVFDESGKKYIELNGNDFSDLILVVVARGIKQCAGSFIEKVNP